MMFAPRSTVYFAIARLAIACSLLLTGLTWGQVPLIKVSTDTFTNNNSEHNSEIEPDSFAFGSTIVSTFQVGRSTTGGASDTGWATSLNGGRTWRSGYLKGISKAENPANPYDLANDPGVGFDAKHGVWMIVTMPWAYAPPGAPRPPAPIPAAVINRSSDGVHWSSTIIKATPDVLSSDKPWVSCDNTATSPFYGTCYVTWNAPDPDFLVYMTTSTDGGLTWGPSVNTPDDAAGVGGLPLIQPGGRVIVPFGRQSTNQMLSFISDDGGASWSNTVLVATTAVHKAAAGFRNPAFPSAEMDKAGTVYLVWQDCHFRQACSANDILLSTSSDGVTWRRPIRIPIDPVSSTVDHFTPGLAVDPNTSGRTAHLALVYYYFANTNCTVATCQLNVGFTSSRDGGATWSPAISLAGPMSLSWLPTTHGAPMIADYISTSYSGGKAFSVFPVAHAKVGTTLDVAMYANATGLGGGNDANAPTVSSAGEEPIANIVSDANAGEDEDEGVEFLSDEMFKIFPSLNFAGIDFEEMSVDVAH